MTQAGWIKLHRKLLDNPIWREKREFSKAECWIDILLNVQHSDDVQEVIIKNQILRCHRGESLRSIETWATRWGMSKSKARRVLILFQNCSMIVLKDVRVSTRLTVLQFSDYNDLRNADETQMKRKRNADETQMNPDKNVKNERMREYIKKDIVHPTDICPPDPVDATKESCRDLVELSKDPGQVELSEKTGQLPGGLIKPSGCRLPMQQVREQADLFSVWYARYPRKVGRKPAWEKWLRIKPLPTKDDLVRMLEVLEHQSRSEQWQESIKLIPMPETYISKQRWDEDISRPDPKYGYAGDW